MKVRQREGDRGVPLHLPANHFGARVGCTATNTIHYAMAWTRNQQHKGRVVTLTILDIKSAFPSTDVWQLLFELQLLGIPKEYTQWLAVMLNSCQTQLCLDDFTLAEFEVMNGLEQGNPLSPILFLYYTSPLLKLQLSNNQLESTTTLSFVDNLGVLTDGDNFNNTHALMELIYRQPNGYNN